MSKRYKNFDLFAKDFKKNTNKILDKLEDEMDDVGDDIVDLIKNRTRKGYGVDKNYGSKQKLAPLKESYKEYRKRYRSQLGGGAKPTKSNLTFSGSMLDSLKAKVKGLSVLVRPTGQDSKGVPNLQKAGQLTKGGKHMKARPFLFLSQIEINRIAKDIRKRVASIIDKLF